MCAQKDQLNSKEDCLYLNVLAPRNTTSSSSLPVMVYIHGGGLRYISLIIYICLRLT
jgi:carboxylesterase type B